MLDIQIWNYSEELTTKSAFKHSLEWHVSKITTEHIVAHIV